MKSEDIVVNCSLYHKIRRGPKMSREKVCISILMVLILIVLSGASVWAAPNGQDLISGIVDTIVIVDGGVDPDTGDPIFIVRVTLVDESGVFLQEVDLYLDAAARLGLVEVDDEGKPVLDPDTGYPIPDETKYETEVNINPETDVIPEEDGVATQHPVALALAEFIAEKLGPDDFYEDIMDLHEQGFGFGLIAQAWWMSWAVDETADHLDPILQAKKGHTLDVLWTDITGGSPEEAPTNWGQFRKDVLGSKKAERNLGEIMSGRDKGDEDEDEDEDENENENVNELGATSTEGKVKGQKDKAGGKPDTPPSQVKDKKDKDKGGGPPAKPPDKVKNKGKGGGKKN
jgi:hypothetical protein